MSADQAWTNRDHEQLMACRSYILSRLIETMEERAASDDWIGNERLAIALAANEWATTHDRAHVTAAGYHRPVTVEDVERIETRAVGHADYASKLALYVAEYVCCDLGGDERL
jgi:hypothetical protein